MLRSVGAIVLALIVGFVVIMAIELTGTWLFPLPPGVDPMDSEALSAAIEAGQVPLGGMVFVVLAYALGSLVAGWVAARVAATSKMRHALIVGGILMVLGIINLFAIPHPLWMTIATLVVFLPLAYLGGRLALRGAAGPEAGAPAAPEAGATPG